MSVCLLHFVQLHRCTDFNDWLRDTFIIEKGHRLLFKMIFATHAELRINNCNWQHLIQSFF